MSRKTLVILVALGLIVIIIGVIFLVRRGQEPPQPETQTQDLVTVSPSTETGGWRLIRHPVFGITFKLPPAWKITVFDNGKGRVEGYFETEGVNGVVSVNRGGDYIKFNPEQFAQNNRQPETFAINRGTIQGIGFVTKQRAGDEPILVENSYLLVNQYFLGDKVLVIFCNLVGPNYRTMIPTCEEIVKGFQFIQ